MRKQKIHILKQKYQFHYEFVYVPVIKKCFHNLEIYFAPVSVFTQEN